MKDLFEQISKLRRSKIKHKVELRLKEFKKFEKKNSKTWFSELCFCILTANSKAKTAIQIQKELGTKGFSEYSVEAISQSIWRNKHRFHNNKAKFIVAARQHINIKIIIVKLVETKGVMVAREWLVKNIKGIGYKEASHFLRNVGYFNVAILDRHIINLMVENGIIRNKPQVLNKKLYICYEQKILNIADKVRMSLAELDLYMWYMKAGDVLK